MNAEVRLKPWLHLSMAYGFDNKCAYDLAFAASSMDLAADVIGRSLCGNAMGGLDVSLTIDSPGAACVRSMATQPHRLLSKTPDGGFCRAVDADTPRSIRRGVVQVTSWSCANRGVGAADLGQPAMLHRERSSGFGGRRIGMRAQPRRCRRAVR